MTGVFQVNTWVSLFTATGVILGATYMLYLYRRVIYGELTKDDLKEMTDLSPREIVIFAPLCVVVMWMGVYPMSFLGVMDASVAKLISDYHTALDAEAALHGVADGIRLALGR